MEIDEIIDDNSNNEEGDNTVIIEEPDDITEPPKLPEFVFMDNTIFENKTQSVEIDEYESDPDSDAENSSERKPLVLKEIVASKGDQSFVIVQHYNENVSHKDFCLNEPSQGILKLDNSIFEQFKDIPKQSIPLDIIDYIENVFSSISCINASYVTEMQMIKFENEQKIKQHLSNICLDTEDMDKFGSEQIDWDQAFHGFNMIEDAQNDRLDELISQSISKILHKMPDVLVSNKHTLDKEVLRIYQILSLFHKFRMNNFDLESQDLISAYAQAILSLTKCAFECLNVWWCGMEKRYFKNLINIFKKSIEFNLIEQVCHIIIYINVV